MAFIEREKMSKRARRALDREKRVLWAVPPASRRIESKKLYNRKKLRGRESSPELFFRQAGGSAPCTPLHPPLQGTPSPAPLPGGMIPPGPLY